MGGRGMRHDEFAERAARCLEEMAAPLEEDGRARRRITAMRANELRVAAHVMRDLSEAVSRKEERGSSVRRLPLRTPS